MVMKFERLTIELIELIDLVESVESIELDRRD